MPQLTLRNLFELIFWSAGLSYFVSLDGHTNTDVAIKLLLILVWIGGGIGRFWNRVGVGAGFGLAIGGTAAICAALSGR